MSATTDCLLRNRTDLMLFFTNGRQGLGLQEKQYLDMPAFEAGVEAILEQ